MLTLALLAAALLLGGMVVNSLGCAARHGMMLAIPCAKGAGVKARFKRLHGLSVMVTRVQIGMAGSVLARFAAGASA